MVVVTAADLIENQEFHFFAFAFANSGSEREVLVSVGYPARMYDPVHTLFPHVCHPAGCVLQVSSLFCSMTSEELFHLPLNIYIIILGIGLFMLMLSLLFCCYMSRYDLTRDPAATSVQAFLSALNSQ